VVVGDEHRHRAWRLGNDEIDDGACALELHPAILPVS
jgi:hypothetical protein